MTVTTTIRKVQYVGDATSTSLPINFPFVEADDIRVTSRVTATGVDTVLTQGVHYTVSGGDYDTGDVAVITPATNFPVGVTWTIERITDRTQSLDYVENDSFPAESHEKGLDKLTYLTQESDEDFDRALKFRSSESGYTADLPASDDMKSKYLGMDSTGKAVVPLGPPAGTTTLSAFWAGVVTLLDAATSRGAAYLDTFENVFTTRGDMLRQGASGEERFPVGTDANDVLSTDATDPLWKPLRTLKGAFSTDYIYGLRIGINASAPTTDIDITSFKCRDRQDLTNIVSATALVKQLDNTWASGTNAGGLSDTVTLSGTPTTLYIHALSDSPTDGLSTTEDVGIDDQQDGSGILTDAAVVAAGLDRSRWIGVIRTDSSDQIESIAYRLADGRWQWISKRIALDASSNSTTVANPFSRTPVVLDAVHEFDTAGDNWSIGDQLFASLTENPAFTAGGQLFCNSSTIGVIYFNTDTIAYPDKTAFTGATDPLTSFVLEMRGLFDTDAL